jgi:hypothetical protein
MEMQSNFNWMSERLNSWRDNQREREGEEREKRELTLLDFLINQCCFAISLTPRAEGGVAVCVTCCAKMAPSSRCLFFLVTFQSLFLISVWGCDYNECRQDAINHEGDWVKCDDCVCNDFNSIADDDGNCDINDEDLYECWIMQDIDDGTITWSCMPRMKTAWIIGFVFISLFACCCIAGLCAFVCKPKKNEDVRVVLVHSQI